MNNPYQQSWVFGKDNNPHRMSLRRKAGRGVGNFADITRLMPVEKLHFIRERARRVAREALQRVWIVGNPFAAIRARVIKG
jgi:hypothetical protein